MLSITSIMSLMGSAAVEIRETALRCMQSFLRVCELSSYLEN